MRDNVTDFGSQPRTSCGNAISREAHFIAGSKVHEDLLGSRRTELILKDDHVACIPIQAVLEYNEMRGGAKRASDASGEKHEQRTHFYEVAFTGECSVYDKLTTKVTLFLTNIFNNG